MRFIPNDIITILCTGGSNYLIILNDLHNKNFYKIPFGTFARDIIVNESYTYVYVCVTTLYSTIVIEQYGHLKSLKTITDKKLQEYKPIYFGRFKYVGKGFKLVLKRKKKFFNCVFGHSHIYWVRLQSIFSKKTKKYKYMFVAESKILFFRITYILKNIKPINRYTLRGVRTYSHV